MQIPVMTEALARRLERAEAEFWISRLGSVRRYADDPLGVEIRQFGESTALVVQALHQPMLNRVIGLTSGDADRLEEIVGWYQAHGIRCRVDVTPFACSQELLSRLAQLGLHPSGFQTVLYGVPQAGAQPSAEGVAVRRLDAADRELFVELRLDMSGVSEGDRAFWRGITEAEYAGAGWRCYVASVDRTPAGMGALYVENGVGSLAADGTLVAYRGRGSQSALLRARIADAAAAGCELVAAQAEPGSVGQRNIERAGLRTAYTRVIWTEGVPGDAR